MDQKISSLFTLVSYSNLVMVVMTWGTTMEDLSQSMTRTTITGAVAIVLKAQVMGVEVMEVDGGLTIALLVYSPDLIPVITGTR